MVSTMAGGWSSPVGAERRIPSWAQGIVAAMARDVPRVVTRDDIQMLLDGAKSKRTPDETISELRRLGWLVHLGIAGTWTFIPPGQSDVVDPYLNLRAWDRIATPGFYLAGANAAWFLGYLDRAPDRKVQILLPLGTPLPKGLRRSVSALRIPWPSDNDLLGPTSRFLVRRRLDLLRWADGLRCIGPEALILQLASRPASFIPWDDLVAHLPRLVEDCDDNRLVSLLSGASAATWQRAAYVLHAGGWPARGIAVLNAAPIETWPVTSFNGAHTTSESGSVFVAQYRLVDRLIAPLQGLTGKT